MSVLFNVLQKAARDYRSLKAPTIVPLLSTSPSVFSKKRLDGILFLCIILTGLFLSLSLPESKVEAASVTTSKQATEDHQAKKLKNARKTAESEPSGISLSVNSHDTEIDSASEKKKSSNNTTTHHIKSATKIVATKEKPKTQNQETDITASKATAQLNPNAAIKHYRAILKSDKNNKTALNALARALGERGGDDDLDVLDGLAESYPSHPSIHAARAHILDRQKDTLESLAAWEKAVALDPKNNTYRLGLAVLHDKLGHAEEAIQQYKSIGKTLPSTAKKRLDYLQSHHTVITDNTGFKEE